MCTVDSFSASKNVGTHSYPQTSPKIHISKHIVCSCLRHCFIETIKYACSAAFSAVKLNDF